MKKKIYVFPIKANKKLFNPYVTYLGDCLSDDYDIVNREGRNYSIFDLYLYFSCDIFIFNWTENLPKLKYGFFQTMAYVIYIIILKFFKSKRIIWIFHNKKPHNEKNYLSNLLLNFNAHISDIVITHAKEGLNYYKNNFKKNNIVYFPHPVYENILPILNIPIKYDFILWGNIEPYKNITSFLRFVRKNDYFIEKKIIICGKCSNKSYLAEIETLLTPNIILLNEFIDENKLINLISESRAILFCHSSSTILSSGALVYSLSFYKPIIGPNTGAFKDYKQLGLIETYNEFDEIESIVQIFKPDFEVISNHLRKYTWKNFSNFLTNSIENK